MLEQCGTQQGPAQNPKTANQIDHKPMLPIDQLAHLKK